VAEGSEANVVRRKPRPPEALRMGRRPLAAEAPRAGNAIVVSSTYSPMTTRSSASSSVHELSVRYARPESSRMISCAGARLVPDNGIPLLVAAETWNRPTRRTTTRVPMHASYEFIPGDHPDPAGAFGKFPDPAEDRRQGMGPKLNMLSFGCRVTGGRSSPSAFFVGGGPAADRWYRIRRLSAPHTPGGVGPTLLDSSESLPRDSSIMGAV